ncbi:MAG: peptide chain release factor N(5)-glutamine methyltransferase [Anaerovoracaceae bacterium]|jgi:release factor glutamine methyltransferase
MSLIIKELMQIGESALKKAGCIDAKIDAELLMQFLLSLNKQQLFIKSSSLLDEKSCEEYFKLIDLRSMGKPVQYITGEQEFMGIPFKVNEDVLIPRQDTETLVEEVINEVKSLVSQKKIPGGWFQILDLCCGSGAIGISLCKYLTNVKVTATDISSKAILIAKENAENAGVSKSIRFEESDLFSSLRKGLGTTKFHIIVSNPPYIESDVIPTLQREIREYEPMIALDGGKDGLDYYRRIIAESPAFLKPNGMLFLEIGYNQGTAVCSLLEEPGRFNNIEVIKDLSGHERVVKCIKTS